MKTMRWICASVLALLVSASWSATTSFSGRLDDPGNPALVYSDLGAAQFGDDLAIANNVALHTFSLAAAGSVGFDSNGFAAGGADPYFSLFLGTGLGATFLASNFAQASTTGGDFLIALDLVAGDYTVAMGVYSNLSFAENFGVGSLGDGFTFLGAPQFLGSSYYELVIETASLPVPEPSTAALMALSLVMLLAGRRRGGFIRPRADAAA